MKPAGLLVGVVVDQMEEPLAGATVLAGRRGHVGSREARTAADGAFELRGVPLGTVPVTAEAEGYAAKTELIELGPVNAPARLVLGLGLPLRLRVVDQAGEPVARAWVWLNTLEDPLRTALEPSALLQASFQGRTDAEGRVEWTDAPLGLHHFDIAAPGHLRTNGVAIPADGQEHLVTLAPALVIQARVTDAATGEPVPQFRLTLGHLSQDPFNNRTNVQFSSIDRFSLAFSGGTYRHSIEEEVVSGGSHPECVVKFEAEGCQPHVSRPLRYDEGVVTLDVALEPAEAFEVTVLDPAGQPAGSAMAGFVFPGANLKLQADGWLGFGGSPEPGALRRADASGRLRLQHDPQVSLVVITHPAGHLETTLAALAAEPEARLRPWGRVEGEFLGAAGTLGGRQVAVKPRDWVRNEL
ncbi:MAG TPA: carboxypeptidase-like regulatory domain-containing protein, partial [Verrucomicrobiota bacterium]|nr:carboxypeptidase-like regulatory domain-containing protein [Verrucomicrobiota bacterium]